MNTLFATLNWIAVCGFVALIGVWFAHVTFELWCLHDGKIEKKDCTFLRYTWRVAMTVKNIVVFLLAMIPGMALIVVKCWALTDIDEDEPFTNVSFNNIGEDVIDDIYSR